MGRWAHLDTDEERLPEGMTRVGYDADSQIYTYRDSDGSYWEGAPGCRYGKLHRVRSATPPLPSAHIVDDNDEEPAYVLHDYDDDDSSEDEKKKHPLAALPLPSSPTKTHPHTHHHRLVAGQTLPDLPVSSSDAETDTLSGTTVRETESIYSTAGTITSTHHSPPSLGLRYSDLPEPPQSHGQGLKRAGTLSRIARFLSSSSPSSSSSALSRRATVAGSRTSTPASRGSGGAHPGWPRARGVMAATSSGRGGDGGGGGGEDDGDDESGRHGMGARRKRATTFDEILGRI